MKKSWWILGFLGMASLGTLLFLLLGPSVRYLPSDEHARALVVIYSGDGGWRTVDQKLAKQLNLDDLLTGNFSVVGIDCLNYFAVKRTPGEVAANLDAIIQDFSQRHPLERVVLVGYSFGADIVPFAYNRLPERSRSKVIMLSLLSPSGAADFQIKLRGLVSDRSAGDAVSIMPELAQIDPRRVQCFYGKSEADRTVCRQQWFGDAEVIALRGGHHFGHRYEPLARRIRSGLEARLAGQAAG